MHSFRILGGVEARAGREVLDLGGRKPAALLALLILHANDGVSTDRLIDELWGEEPPRTARKSLQVHVSRLRKELGEGIVETRPHGYALRVERGQVDLYRFEDLLEQGRDALRAGEPRETASVLREALALWRGEPLAGLEAEPFARPAAARLEDLRLAAVELRIEADLALGRHAGLVGELERLVSEHPYREGLRRQLMLALYRSGRQADALAAYRSARRTFMEELGVEPAPELRELEAAVLRHDPALAPPASHDGRPARKRRVLVAGIVAAALALAAAAGIFAAVRGPGNSPSASRTPVANSVLGIDPRTSKIEQVTGVGREPDSVAVGAGAVWVVNWQDRTISRIDASGAVETIGGVPRADHLAVDGDNVWVSSFDRSSVARINADSGEVVESLGVASKHAEGLAIGGGYLWITNPATVRWHGIETVSRVDLRSHKVVSTIPVGATPIFDTFGDGALWVANYDDDTISVVSAGSQDPETIALGECGPLGIATGFGSVWVVCYWQHRLLRIDSRTRRIVARIPVGDGPLGVTTGAGAVWVTNRSSRTVTRIDPRSNAAVTAIRLPAPLSPFGIAVGNGYVWVSVRRCPQTCI